LPDGRVLTAASKSETGIVEIGGAIAQEPKKPPKD
jgi:hypothetical protein